MPFFFRFEQDHFKIEYACSFYSYERKLKSDTESLKRFQIALKRKMTIEKTSRHWGRLFLLQNLLKFRLKCLLTFVVCHCWCKLYVHLVRPHLDYASQVQVWSPHQEAVQHRATKLMVGNRVSYKERLNKTSLMWLYSRRIYLDFIFFIQMPAWLLWPRYL